MKVLSVLISLVSFPLVPLMGVFWAQGRLSPIGFVALALFYVSSVVDAYLAACYREL
jgi:hypothetical protein